MFIKNKVRSLLGGADCLVRSEVPGGFSAHLASNELVTTGGFMLYDPYKKNNNLDTFYELVQGIFALALLLTMTIGLFILGA